MSTVLLRNLKRSHSSTSAKEEVPTVCTKHVLMVLGTDHSRHALDMSLSRQLSTLLSENTIMFYSLQVTSEKL